MNKCRIRILALLGGEAMERIFVHESFLRYAALEVHAAAAII
jgi:hypothetical protein